MGSPLYFVDSYKVNTNKKGILVNPFFIAIAKLSCVPGLWHNPYAECDVL